MKKLLIQSTVFAMILLSACSHSSPPQDALPANSTLTATESSLQSVNETTSPGIEAKESCSQPGSGFSDTENMQTSTGPVKKEPVTTGIPPTTYIENETVEETGTMAEQPVATETTCIEQPEPTEVPKETVPCATETTESEEETVPTEPPVIIPKPDPAGESTAPEFDIDYWVAYAKSIAVSKGLVLERGAKECWDNPITANSNCIYLERDINSRMNRYARDEDTTEVWVWYEKVGEDNYLIYVGYA